jgi:hypothetical protein
VLMGAAIGARNMLGGIARKTHKASKSSACELHAVIALRCTLTPRTVSSHTARLELVMLLFAMVAPSCVGPHAPGVPCTCSAAPCPWPHPNTRSPSTATRGEPTAHTTPGDTSGSGQLKNASPPGDTTPDHAE